MWVYFVCAAFLWVPLVWAAYRAGVTRGAAATEAKLSQGIESGIAELRQTADFATARWGETELKLTSLQQSIAGILKERDDWVKLYSEQSIAHGNAQTLMMGWIEQQADALKKAGRGLKTPAVIAQVRDDFMQEHVQPTLKRAGIPTIHQGPTGPSVAESTSSVKTSPTEGVT